MVNLEVQKPLSEEKFCPKCGVDRKIELVIKPDVDLKLCKVCGSALSIRYKDS